MSSAEITNNSTECYQYSAKDTLLNLYSLALSQNTAKNYPQFKDRLFLSRKPLNENGLVSFDNSGPWQAGQLFPTHTEKYGDVLANYGYPKFCELDADYRPLHPFWKEMILNPNIGGVVGKGFFYHWGANYTADTAIIARDEKEADHILLIKRQDTGEWALPGGFLNKDEDPFQAALRELQEETSINYSSISYNKAKLYKGPVLDIRTTLHAWTETTLWSLELSEPGLLLTKAQDDAEEAKWHKLSDLPDNIYGSHPFLIDQVLRHHASGKVGLREA